ncbi:unnamed protein product [Plutella xylostella]|uniref:Cryptochrome-1 n=1 Tax=Plutella xylostella TaxID=51655 RepID=A0A8S4G0T3_PLUXY|nr:unnamed protein product [Plutella xylostella]
MLIGEFESQATPSPRSSRAARCGCPGSTGCTTSSSTCWTLIGEFESVIETRWMLIGEFESQATPSPRSSRAARCGCPGSTGCTTSSSTCWTLIESGNTVASFLTRGTLWLSWEHGLHHFLKYLLDADWSVCAGNWMWVSSSAFEALLDSGECADPVRLGQRLDPSGEYVRRYVPELSQMPRNYVYEPWKAPLEVQERANCVIGRDYPAPIVNHLAAAASNRAAMQELRLLLQKAPPHCCPSSDDEIRQFMWLHGETNQPDERKLSSNCVGIRAAPHCCPSSDDEIRQFMWLHGETNQPDEVHSGI